MIGNRLLFKVSYDCNKIMEHQDNKSQHIDNYLQNDVYDSYDEQEMPLLNEFSTTNYDNVFLMRIYQYYYHKGFNNIILKQITNLLNTIFIVLFTLFLLNCIDYERILKMDSKMYLYEFIHWNNFFTKMGFFSVICFIILVIFSAAKIIKLINSYKTYKIIRNYYNCIFLISDDELQSLEWNDVVKKMTNNVNIPFISSYTIANQIMRKENYIIALISNHIISCKYFSKIIEISFIYCVIDYFFDERYNIRDTLFYSGNHLEIIAHIKRRLKIMGFLYFLFMPFIFIYYLFHAIFKYGETFYNQPELLGTRKWSIASYWLFREYNELDHIFKNRLEEGKKCANTYIEQFYSRLLETIVKFIIFICSAFLIVLILTSLLNEAIVMKLYISKNQSVLWYIGILGTVITLCKTFVHKKCNGNPNEIMEEIVNKVKYLPEKWIENAHKSYIKDEFTKYYQYQIYIIIKECITIILIPYILWNYCSDVDKIYYFLLNNTVHNEVLGYVCKFSIFGGDGNIEQENNNNISNMEHEEELWIKTNKLQQSFISFRQYNPGVNYKQIVTTV